MINYNYNHNQNPFWMVNENNQVKLNEADLVDFFNSQGFFKYSLDNGGYEVVRIFDNVIRKSGDHSFTEVIQEYLKKIGERRVFNTYLRKGGITKALRDALPYFEGGFMRDTSDTSFFYFQNGVLKVSSDGMQLTPYSDLPNAVWEKEVLPRNWVDTSPSGSVFEDFVTKVSGNSPDQKEILESIIGYLLSDYKDAANARAIIFLDSQISEEGKANGGSGKSLMGRAIGHLRPIVQIDSKIKSDVGRFKFQQVRESTRLLFYDDVRDNFNFEDFYSVITGDMTVERKYMDAYTIPFALSPKILISSNYMVKGTGGSSDSRRMLEFQFSDYFHEGHTPLDEFGKRFFDEWNEVDWARFDAYMMTCVQRYLQKGLLLPDNQELKRRKLEISTSPKFVEFALANIAPGTFDKRELREQYNAFANEVLNEPSSIRFKKWLDDFARFMGYHTDHRKSDGRTLVDFISDN